MILTYPTTKTLTFSLISLTYILVLLANHYHYQILNGKVIEKKGQTYEIIQKLEHAKKIVTIQPSKGKKQQIYSLFSIADTYH